MEKALILWRIRSSLTGEPISYWKMLRIISTSSGCSSVSGRLVTDCTKKDLSI